MTVKSTRLRWQCPVFNPYGLQVPLFPSIPSVLCQCSVEILPHGQWRYGEEGRGLVGMFIFLLAGPLLTPVRVGEKGREDNWENGKREKWGRKGSQQAKTEEGERRRQREEPSTEGEPWRSKAGHRETIEKEVDGNRADSSQPAQLPGPAQWLSSAFSSFVILLVIAPVLEREMKFGFVNFRYLWLNAILVFYCCCKKSLWTSVLKISQANYSSGGRKPKMGLTGLRSRYWKGFLKVLGENVFLCLFQLSETTCILCLMAPFIPIQSQ